MQYARAALWRVTTLDAYAGRTIFGMHELPLRPLAGSFWQAEAPIGKQRGASRAARARTVIHIIIERIQEAQSRCR